jgi:arylsulfatase A-like enzyme
VDASQLIGDADGPVRATVSPTQLLATALWFGLLAGLLEIAVLAAQDAYRPTVTLASIRTNHHYLWMIPISTASMFAVCGLAVGVVLRGRRQLAARLSPYLFCFLAAIVPLLAIRGLYTVAALLFAGGTAARVAPVILRHTSGFRRVVQIGLPAMLAIVTALIATRGTAVAFAGNRALAELPASCADAPNLILIVMDNVRADHLSLHGYDRETTPNLARLARRGVRFDLARATAPWTLPSHASMFTGRWPHQLSTSVDTPLDDSAPTLASFLAGQGYATAGFVANTYYCNAWYGLDRGFAHYEDFEENLAITPVEILRSSNLGGRLVELAGIEVATPGEKESRKTAAMVNADLLGWLDGRDGRPFFAFLNYYDAHAPFDPPDGHPRRFGLSALDEPSRRAISKSFRALTRRGETAPGDAPRNDEEIVSQASTLLADSYDDCIAYLDDQIGRLFDDLDRRGLLENTAVIITSDHGEHFSDRGLYGHGHSLYRPLIDVPLVVIPPRGREATATVDADRPVSLRDLPATAVDLLGLTDRSPFPGRSLARLWRENVPDMDEVTDLPFSHVEHQPRLSPTPHIPASLGPLWSIIDQDQVYIRNGDGREELYNIETDPSETRNLAENDDARLPMERFRTQMNRILAEQPNSRHRKRVRSHKPHRSTLCGINRTRRAKPPRRPRRRQKRA